MPTQVYFEDEDGVGDFYDCLSAASAGQSPTTHPSKWAKIEIPAFLRSAIVEMASGQLQQSDGQSDRRARSMADAGSALYQTFVRHRPRGDYKPMPVHRARD